MIMIMMMHLMIVYTKHKQCYPASNVSARIFFFSYYTESPQCSNN